MTECNRGASVHGRVPQCHYPLAWPWKQWNDKAAWQMRKLYVPVQRGENKIMDIKMYANPDISSLGRFI